MLLATPWFTLFTYSVVADAAFLAGLGLVALEVRRLGIPRSDALQAGFWALVGAGLGGRILYARLHWLAYDSDRLGLLRFWEGGLAWPGALIGGAAFVALYAWATRRSCWRYADAAAPALALGAALGNLAHLLNGSAYGAVTDSPLALNLPDLNGVYLPRYPTQFIEMTVLLILFGVLWGRRGHWPLAGAGFLLYAIASALAGVLVEFLRGDAVMAVGPLRATQVIGGIICLTAIVALVWRLASRKAVRRDRFDV